MIGISLKENGQYILDELKVLVVAATTTKHDLIFVSFWVTVKVKKGIVF